MVWQNLAILWRNLATLWRDLAIGSGGA